MTENIQYPAKIVVVAEQEVYDLLRGSGVYWDTQHRVDSVGQMWDDLSGGRLDQQSLAIVFSDSAYAVPGELEGAIAAMAPYATTFLVSWQPERLQTILAGVAQAAVNANLPADAPVHVLYPNSKRDLLDGIRNVFASTGVPIPFPDAYPLDVDGPVYSPPVEVPVWDPTTPVYQQPGLPVAPQQPVYEQPAQPVYTEPAAPAPVAPVAPAPVAPAVPEPQTYPAPVQPVAPVAPVAQPPVPQPATPVHVVVPPAPTPVAPVSQPDPSREAAVAAGFAHSDVIPGQVTLAVTSSKGGSGKSTTAMMLAAQIAHSSKLAFEQGKIDRPLKVCLVDMDTRDGQVASLIGCYVPTALNIRVSPTWDKETILKHLVHDPKLGIDALLAPVRPRTADDVGPDFYREIIRTLKTTHDVVIMDTSVNYLDPLIATVCLPESTAILFVTTLATTSVQGMARALREITEPEEHGGMGVKRNKIGIVVNQAITDVGMDRDQVLQAALRVSIVGAIPFAAKDVLISTNYNRMHQLLKHPLLGPAYFKLAQTCLPNRPLVPVLAPTNPAQAAAGAPTAPQPKPGPVSNQSGNNKRTSLFSRKG